MDTSRIVITAEMGSSSSEDLFNAFVQPEILVQWWPVLAEVEPGVGGGYQFSWPKQNWKLYGSYIEYEPGCVLKFTWNWEHEPKRLEPLRVTLRFSDGRIELSHGRFDPDEASQKDRRDIIEGWTHFLEKLRKTLASP